VRVTRSARFARSDGVLFRIRKQARFAPNAFRRSPVLTRALSRQCIFALTRPGFASKIPHPFHSRASFPTHDPVEEPYASRELARPVLKGSLSKASSERSYRHVVSTSAAHLHSFFKDEHHVSLATGFVPGLRPFLPGGAARYGEPPRERRVGARTREHCPLSRPAYPTEPLDVPSRPWSRGLPASLPETSSPFSSRARELSRSVPNQDAFSR
jgi:hypothetical protein